MKAINTANSTIRYLHLYLWCRKPEKVVKWLDSKEGKSDDLIIKNLDDSFLLFKTSATFRKGIKIYEIGDLGDSETTKFLFELSSHKNPNKFINQSETVTCIAGLYIIPGKKDVTEQCVFFPHTQMQYIINRISPAQGMINQSPEHFDSGSVFNNGVTVSIQSKDYSMEFEPVIRPDQSVAVFKVNPKTDTQIMFGDIKISHVNPLDKYPTDKHLDRGMSADVITVFSYNGNYARCLIVPFSSQENQLVQQICKLRM